MVRKKLIPVLLLMVAAVLPTGGQQQDRASEQPHRLLLHFEQAEGAEFSPEELLYLYESLLVVLYRESSGVKLLEHFNGTGSSTDDEVSQIARQSEADSWLRAEVSGNLQNPLLRVRLYDLNSESEALDRYFEAEEWPGLEQAGERIWEEVVRALKESYMPIAMTGDLEIRARPETTIYGLSPEPLVVGVEGRVEIRLPIPGTYSIRASHPDTYPVRKDIYLQEVRKLLVLDQEEGPHHALDFYLHTPSFPGFEATYYFNPGRQFIRSGIDTFSLGIRLRDTREDGTQPPVLVGWDLQHLDLAFGTYLSRKDRFLRFYLANGLFLRFRFNWDEGLSADPYSGLGFSPLLGAEYGRGEKKRVFIEYQPFFYLTAEPERLRSDLEEITGSAGIACLGHWLLDFHNFRIGFRWLF